jgi:acyl-CoA oxidase
MRNSLTIAIRYSLCRKQFAFGDNDQESPVLDYPLQQMRIFPFLASFFALNSFASWLTQSMLHLKKISATDSSAALSLTAEIHAISSASKPYCSWKVRDCIQECREACGGHGYASVSRFGALREDHDPNMTYEGENRVLLQQCSRFLLRGLQAIVSKKNLTSLSPLGSLFPFVQIPSDFKLNMLSPRPQNTDLLRSLQARSSHLIRRLASFLIKCKQEGLDSTTSWNLAQVSILFLKR